VEDRHAKLFEHQQHLVRWWRHQEGAHIAIRTGRAVRSVRGQSSHTIIVGRCGDRLELADSSAQVGLVGVERRSVRAECHGELLEALHHLDEPPGRSVGAVSAVPSRVEVDDRDAHRGGVALDLRRDLVCGVVRANDNDVGPAMRVEEVDLHVGTPVVAMTAAGAQVDHAREHRQLLRSRIGGEERRIIVSVCVVPVVGEVAVGVHATAVGAGRPALAKRSGDLAGVQPHVNHRERIHRAERHGRMAIGPRVHGARVVSERGRAAGTVRAVCPAGQH